MNVLEQLGGQDTIIAPLDALLRLLAAVIAGALIGIDRELRNKPAGLRTHILIALAACLFTLITFELHAEFTKDMEGQTADPIRIIEAVTAGVAFLAAGAIIQSRTGVQGLTTGANMWLAGALGVACGGGFYVFTLMGVGFAVVVLVVLGRLQATFAAHKSSEPSAEPPAEPPRRP